MKKWVVILLLGMALMAKAEDTAMLLAAHQKAYEKDLANIDAGCKKALAAWPDQYLQALKNLEQKFQDVGDLENLMTVRKESARFTAAKQVAEDMVVQAPKDLADLQRKAMKSEQNAELKKSRQVVSSAEKYLAILEQLKKDLTKNGNVDDAIVVNAEIGKVKQRPEVTAAQFTVAAAGADSKPPEQVAANPVPTETSTSTKGLPSAITRNLVLYYPFSAGVGNTVVDKSGKGHTGKVYGAKWTPKGKVGGAYEFNGKGDYIDTKANFSGFREMTVCGWSFFTKTPADSSIITQYGGSQSENVWALFSAANGRGAEVNFCPASGGDYNFYGNAYEMKTWKHLCVTYAAGKALTLYEDGAPVNSVAVPDSPLRRASNTAKVAASQAATGYWGSGLIDEVMIFDRALTEDEVKQVYDLQK